MDFWHLIAMYICLRPLYIVPKVEEKYEVVHPDESLRRGKVVVLGESSFSVVSLCYFHVPIFVFTGSKFVE